MKKHPCFMGVGTALVTPFSDGEIDYVALGKLIDSQIAADIGALVIGGTTGEAATLSDAERERLYSFSAEKVGGRVKLLFGTGSPDTKAAIRYTKFARAVGADGALAVTPYYNKGTATGLYHHFMSIAECADIPTIIYNVPTRTAVNLPVDTLFKLSEHENIRGLKESSDSLERLSELCAIGDALPLYSGNDYANLLFYSVGAVGAVSVVSNLFPKESMKIFETYRSGNVCSALRLQCEMKELAASLFAETNPSPVKFALERLGMCSCEVRLPLAPPSSSTRERVVKALDNYQKRDMGMGQ